MDDPSQKTLMTIFAHQDDETFSAGGILAKYAKNGKSHAVSVTSDPNREDEFNKACKILGVEPINLPFSNVEPEDEINIRSNLMEIIRLKKPDHIITHTDFDYHYEHRGVRNIVEEVVEWVSHNTSDQEAHQISSLWAAETTVLIPSPQILIDISEENSKRMQAIACYESQLHKGGEGFYSKFHRVRTNLRGIQANVEHAEAYLQIPIIRVGSFKPLSSLSYLPF